MPEAGKETAATAGEKNSRAGRKGQRCRALDWIRGITLVSMILYHGAWDLVYLFGANWDWYRSKGAYVWQQSICWTFILLSGFCWALGGPDRDGGPSGPFWRSAAGRKLRRGLTVFAGGALITAATVWLMPQNRVVFGVLTLLGSCMILLLPLRGAICRIPPAAGMAASAVLFVLTRDVNRGFWGFEGWNLTALPESWYKNLFTTWLGFPEPGFFSTDYFSLIPWLFLFLTGVFFSLWMQKKGMPRCLFTVRIPALEWVGRHSLELYMVHQPVLYALLWAVFGKG